jgi:Asp-tRNA(Asn)/Glu-tRNA(Gln) amidotransferase A subunit family amidase
VTAPDAGRPRADHPQDLSLRDQAAAIAAGELDATELLEATLSRIEERDSGLNSIVDSFASESAGMLNEAPEGPLHGVPIAVKDMFALPWRAPRDGSVRNLTGVEAGESAVYRRLRDAGAVVVGVTNMHEHGAGSTGHVSAYGPCGNPWDPARCGGGSSGGSAAAVGARLVAGAVGTDGGGSIRYPAAYCGVTGLKLTWGLVPSDGYTHAYSSMSAPGPLCRDATDARLLAEALVGRPLERRRAVRLRLGTVPALWDDVDPEIAALCQAAVGSLRDAGMEVAEVDLDGLDHVRISTVLRLTLEDAAAVPPQVARAHEPELSPIGRALSKYRALIPAEALVRADAVRALLRRSLVDASAQADVLVWPTVAAPAPAIEDTTVQLPSGAVPADYANVRMGGIANLTGAPALSAPVGVTRAGLPVGLHLITHWRDPERLLDVAELLEQVTERRHVDALPPLAQKTPA